jgi:hypothetical protein
MNDSLDTMLSERFSTQYDAPPGADLADARERAHRLRSATPAQRPRRRIGGRLSLRMGLVAAALAVLVGGGTATGFAIRALTQSPVTRGFSALRDPNLPQAPEDTPELSASLRRFFREQLGPDYHAKQVADGMFLAHRGRDLCAAVFRGFGGCTDHLGGDVWLHGDLLRTYDAETAPFEVHFYGFARDNVAAVRVTTTNGNTVTLPVAHNAFQTTLSHTTFADIAAIEVIYTSRHTTSIDPRKYFPSTMPVGVPPSQTTPGGSGK